MARQSYSREMVGALTFSVAIALMDGGVIAVLAQKVFHVSPLAFATILAAPMFANLTSFLWAYAARGRAKVRFIATLQVAMLVTVGLVALLPQGDMGGLLLVGLVIVGRCLLAGIVTIRSTIWRMNYARAQRGRITGNLVLVASLLLAIAPLIGYSILDINTDWFRVLYPAAVVVGVIGVIAFVRIRLRGEQALLRFERQPLARPSPHGAAGPIYEYDPKESLDQRQSFWTVLRHDHFFRRYMVLQFIQGLANMMGEVAIISLVIQWTKGMAVEYRISILLITTIPLLVATATLPGWARYLDRVHIVRFRTRHGWFWVATQLGHWVAAYFGSLWLLVIPRIFQGCVRGGGMLAWNLGHNDFADRRMVALYMGIHVTLTGVRGAIAPYAAILLLNGWSGDSMVGGWLIPFDGMGANIFLLTTALALVALLGYGFLERSMQGHQAT